MCGWPILISIAKSSPAGRRWLQAIARKTQHAGRTTLSVSSTHGEQQTARRAYLRIARFFARLREKAEQLDAVQRWYRILSEALRKYLRAGN